MDINITKPEGGLPSTGSTTVASGRDGPKLDIVSSDDIFAHSHSPATAPLYEPVATALPSTCTGELEKRDVLLSSRPANSNPL